MGLTPSIRPRERLLTFGVAGVGKSNAILNLARYCPESTFHVMDNDFSYDRLLATDYSDLANVYPFVPDLDEPWTSLLDWAKERKGEVAPDDWVVYDSLTPTWDWVQAWYTEGVFKQDMAEYFLEVRKMKTSGKEGGKDKNLGAFEGFMDWPVINKQYMKLYQTIVQMPCHVYGTAELANISEDKDAEIKSMYGSYGVRPKGQKSMGHKFSTVLLLTKSRAEEYRITTIKDRGRREVENLRVEEFAFDYFAEIAGWQDV